LLGIDPHTIIYDKIGRPYAVARGSDPIKAIIA